MDCWTAVAACAAAERDKGKAATEGEKVGVDIARAGGGILPSKKKEEGAPGEE
jgi:hypothetical protein